MLSEETKKKFVETSMRPKRQNILSGKIYTAFVKTSFS